MAKKFRVALDMGGVIAPPLAERMKDGGNPFEPGPVTGAFEAVEKLVRKIGTANCFIISRVSSDEKVKANWEWLRHWGFFEKTGFDPANVIIYTGERAQKAKFVRDNKINVMVDDRFEILSSMDQGVMLIAFNSDPEEQRQFALQMRLRMVYLFTQWKQFEAHFGL